jgi:HEAT repeat protein
VRTSARFFLLVALYLFCCAFEWPGRIDRLVRELDRGDAETRKAAARQLGQFSEKASGEALLKALEDDDPGVRIEAAHASARARVRRAVPILREWLHDKDAGLRRAGVTALGKLSALRGPNAEADLVRALGDASVEVRVAAVEALRESGAREAVVPLIGRLEDGDPVVRNAALKALGALRDERAVMPLLTQLLDPSPELAGQAASALGAIGDARAAAPLASALSHGSIEVRVAAAGALLRLRNASAVPALESSASDPEAVVARAALAALGRIDDPAARTALLGKLGSLHGHAASDALVEQARLLRAAVTLEEARATANATGEPGAMTDLAALITALAQRSTAQDKESGADHAVKTLARIGRFTPIDAAIGPLVGLLRSAPEALRPAVLQALAASDRDEARIALLDQLSTLPRSLELLDALEQQLGRAFAAGQPDGRAADPLIDQIPTAAPGELPRLVHLLGMTSAERAAPVLLPLLEASQPSLRAAAATALGRTGATVSAPRLLVRLADEDASVRESAALSLRTIGDRTTASALLDLLEDNRTEPGTSKQPISLASAGVRARSLAALTALGGVLARMHDQHSVPESLASRAFALLAKRVKSRDPELSDRALDALADWGPPRTIELLGQLLRTSSARTRALVAAAIGRLEHEDTRLVLRYVLDQGGTRAAVAACAALAEVGDERDVSALQRAARRRSWPLPAAATYAIAKIAVRGALKPHFARRELCEVGVDRAPYIRANVAAALAMLGVGACEDGGPDPLVWLSTAKAPSVRYAAARWTRAALANQRLDAKTALAALDQCALQEGDPYVRAVCRGETDVVNATATKELTLRALPAGAQRGAPATRDSLIAARLSSGLVLLSYTDHNGELYAGRAPEGLVVLESPASAELEAPLRDETESPPEEQASPTPAP